MGKKRTRVPGETRASQKGVSAENPTIHIQTLEEDVREQRDSQFALEKKQAERTKRRRMTPQRFSESKSQHLEQKNELFKSKREDARTAGLQIWRNAAIRRKTKKTDGDAGDDDDDKDGEEIEVQLDKKTNAKVLEEARQQRAEIRAEANANGNGTVQNDAKFTGTESQKAAVNAALRTLAAKNDSDDDSDNDDDGDDDDDDGDDASKGDGPSAQFRKLGLVNDDGRSVAADTEYDMQSTFGDDDRDLEFLDGSKVTEEDELALSLFNTQTDDDHDSASQSKPSGESDGPKIMLADIILQKIQEKEEANARVAAIAADPERAERERKIAEVYGLVGNIMSKYRSGKVPKAFKVIPKAVNWEELLYMTRPDEWSPAAVYVATRILASNLSGKQVVSFYSDILLPRCLEDISAMKKLNYHLYQALVKAVYKPGAFCKGILFPLCSDGDRGCTMRQATVFASVVAKVSIPMLHSAAALLYMCGLRFSVTTCMLITALIEKKYALPYRVVDAAVDWFVGMKSDTRPLPVVWHKCLLAVAQRYKTELTKAQKERIKLLMRVHTHKLITPEIRRELFSSRNRGELIDPDANTIAKNIEEAAMQD